MDDFGEADDFDCEPLDDCEAAEVTFEAVGGGVTKIAPCTPKQRFEQLLNEQGIENPNADATVDAFLGGLALREVPVELRPAVRGLEAMLSVIEGYEDDPPDREPTFSDDQIARIRRLAPSLYAWISARDVTLRAEHGQPASGAASRPPCHVYRWRANGRTREARAGTTRRQGSRRTASRSSGDDPDGEPEPPGLRLWRHPDYVTPNPYRLLLGEGRS